MLHEAEGAEPEDAHTGDGEGSPVSVQVLLNCLMEHTVASIINNESSTLVFELPSDRLSLDALSEITWLLGSHVELVQWGAGVALID